MTATRFSVTANVFSVIASEAWRSSAAVDRGAAQGVPPMGRHREHREAIQRPLLAHTAWIAASLRSSQ